jgi:mannosyltransferase OCH1-like enzyme
MTGLYVGHNRRQRKKLTYLTFFAVFFFIFLLRSYFIVTYNVLIKGPWIARNKSEHMRISAERDNFDLTFESYSREAIFAPNMSMPVPPIMHHIYLGTPRPGAMGSHETARQACVALHPGYEFKYWTDFEAEDFVARNYPDLYDMWSRYPFVIQKADSLRYMILYIYGGEFSHRACGLVLM